MGSGVSLRIWYRLHWSLRYQLTVLIADLVTKLAVVNFLEQGVGHFAFLNTWGLGIGWLEHSTGALGWWLPLAILLIWLGWFAWSRNSSGLCVRNGLNLGVALATAGGFANAIDVARYHSVSDWILLVTPWFNQVLNIADLAIVAGSIAILIEIVEAVRFKAGRA